MREWNLQEGDPITLTLAADARLGAPDYLDDQIWELRTRAGEPAAVDLHTTYGLRARNMRIFLRFTEGDVTVCDPQDFTSRPAIHRFFPNYFLVTFSPFSGIDVVHELWVPESHVLAGRLRIINSGVTSRSLGFELAALLLPAAEGQRMTSTKLQGVTVLQGQTGNLTPTIFLTGGPQAKSSPYPCLIQELELLPTLERSFTWVHAGLGDPELAFDTARQTAARNWEAEIARVELVNAALVDVHTGDANWDAAFAMAQKVALGLVHGPTEHLPHPSFVTTRGPDQGYSLRGDGSDYNYLWNGQSAFDAWYLGSLILPAAPSLAAGFLRNFLATQTREGYVDWKPGLGGQRTRMDATPLLSSLAWEIFRTTRDREFLREIFPELLTFVLAWFSPYHDRDEDGIPEWDHPMQSGFEDHPLFAHWQPWSQGVDITMVENPALCALLYRECQALIQIARQIERPEPIRPLQALADNLRTAVEAAWDGRSRIYRYWDRDTHLSLSGEVIYRRQGPGHTRLRRRYRQPVRPHVRVQVGSETTRKACVRIRGTRADGEPAQEEITDEAMRWYLGTGSGTSQQVFRTITRVEVSDLPPEAEVTVSTVDLTFLDHSLLLPLSAGIPDGPRARLLIEKTLSAPKRFWRAFGIPACVSPPSGEGTERCAAVWMPWNALIAEGLLAYGHRRQAAELISRLMAATVGNLQRERTFRSHYQADTGRGIGDRNALNGLPPLALFLKTLGVGLISPWQVALEGATHFPGRLR